MWMDDSLKILPARFCKKDLWEIRSRISDERIARVIFHMSGGEMILLHGFIKKTQQTPHQNVELADRRRREYESHA
jgi:phage-related protein